MKTSIPSILIVISVSEIKEDNGSKAEHRSYRTIGVRTPNTKIIEGITNPVNVKPRETAFNAYKSSYLDNKTEFGFDFKVGESLLGDIVTKNVSPYPIISVDKKTGEEVTRMVDTASVLVFGDNTSETWDNKIVKAFKAKGYTTLEEEQNPTVASSLHAELA